MVTAGLQVVAMVAMKGAECVEGEGALMEVARRVLELSSQRGLALC